MPGLAKETPPPRQAALESTLTCVCERTDPAQRSLPYPRGWDEDSLTGTRSSGKRRHRSTLAPNQGCGLRSTFREATFSRQSTMRSPAAFAVK